MSAATATARHVVTVHALHRYMERALGIDVEGIRAEIKRKVEEAIIAGASGLAVDGVLLIFQDGVIVTAAPGKPKRRRRADDKARQRMRFEEARRCR